MQGKIDYVAKLNEIGRTGKAESLNAAPYYKKAFELYIEKPEQLDINIWPGDLSEEENALLQNWISANSKSLEQLKLGIEKSYHLPEYQESSMWHVKFTGLTEARNLMFILCSQAKLHASKGNFEEAFSELLTCYQFGRHFAGSMFLIEQLVGIAISSNAVQDSFHILNKYKINPCLLSSFQQNLQTLLSKQMSVINFTAEKFLAYESIQMLFTVDGEICDHINRSMVEEMVEKHEQEGQMSPQAVEELRQSWNKLERQQTTELADKVYEYLGSAAHNTPWRLHSEDKNPKKVAKEMTKDNPLLNMLIPSVDVVLELPFNCKAETNALITTIAILRYKSEKGEYPSDLHELLATGYLNELPMDPYSDNPLIYKCTGDDFILYSIGADFKDDGGKPSRWGKDKQGGDQVFWPVSRK